MSTSADEEASFTLSLEDQISSAAEKAASALVDLRDKINADKKALGEMQSAERALAKSAEKGSQEHKALKTQIDALKATVAKGTAEYVKLGGTFRDVATEAKKVEKPLHELEKGGHAASGGLDKLFVAGRKLPGPLGQISGGLDDVIKLVVGGGALAAGALAIVAVLGVLVVGLAAGTAALLQYGVAQSDARRNELLRLESLTTLRNAHGVAAGSATAMQAAIDRVSQSVSTGRVQVEGYAASLYRAGLRGQAYEDALRGVATTAAVQGDAQAKAFERAAISANRQGRSVSALADVVQTRLGGVARRQMLSLDVQATKLQESLGRIFGDLHIDSALKALRDVGELFEQNTASGRALKHLAETIFNPMLDTLGRLGPVARDFFEGMVIAALRTTIQVVQLRNWFRRTFGSSDLLNGINATEAGVDAMNFAIGGTVAVLGTVALLAAAVAAPFVLAGAAVYYVLDAFDRLNTYLIGLGASWEKSAESMISGLADGLRGGFPRIVSAAQDLARSAQDAFSAALGIHSPSRVFAELGLQIPRGLAAGVDEGAGVARRSVADMVSADRSALPNVQAGAPGAAASAPVSVTFGDIIIHTQTDSPREAAAEFRDELAKALESVGIEMGAPR